MTWNEEAQENWKSQTDTIYFYQKSLELIMTNKY